MSDTAPLTLDAAVGLLDAVEAPEPDETAQPVEQDTPSEAEPPAEDEPETEESIGDEDEEEQEPAEEPIIPAPHSWDAEARAVFQTLPREAQQVIAAREKDRDDHVLKATTEAAESRKRADAEVQGITQLRDVTAQILSKAEPLFKGKWGNVDWDTWFATDPAAALIGERQMKSEEAELQRLAAVQQQQSAVALQAFQQQKAERIKTEAPDLVDPVKGADRVRSLESFLESNGISRDIFHTLDAFTIGLAYDGFRYREAQKTAPKQPPARTSATVRPAAAQSVQSPQRAAQALKNRFAQTGSIEDALAVMNSRTK